jgi:hypothetical protein
MLDPKDIVLSLFDCGAGGLSGTPAVHKDEVK